MVQIQQTSTGWAIFLGDGWYPLPLTSQATAATAVAYAQALPNVQRVEII